MSMKPGFHIQAAALVELMLKKGLIEEFSRPNIYGLRCRLTPKGKDFVRRYEEEQRALSSWADAEMGIDRGHKD